MRTSKSVVALGVALGIGLTATHHTVPPTPGPLGVAGIFGLDVGQMMIAGLLFAIPVFITDVFYAKWLGTKIYQLPDESGLEWVRPEQPKTFQEFIEMEEKKELPSFTRSMLPIVIPIVLIFLNTTVTAIELEGGLYDYIQFLGAPVIAVGIGLIVAIYGLIHHVSSLVIMTSKSSSFIMDVIMRTSLKLNDTIVKDGLNEGECKIQNGQRHN